MARKNTISSHKVFDAIDLTSTQNSPHTKTINLDRASVSISWSGSDAVGEIKFQARKIKESTPDVLAASDWKDLDFGASIDITGASGTHEVIFDALDFTDLRAVFEYTSGSTGTLTATMSAKTVGA